MANTYHGLFYHVIWSVKDRDPMLGKDIQARLWPYIVGIGKTNGIASIKIGGHYDHIHALIALKPNMPVSKAVQLLKGGSSKWIHETFPPLQAFAWQSGYAAFTVSKSQVDTVRSYIENQEEHHRVKTFEEEYRRMLDINEIDYDEVYLLG